MLFSFHPILRILGAANSQLPIQNINTTCNNQRLRSEESFRLLIEGQNTLAPMLVLFE